MEIHPETGAYVHPIDSIGLSAPWLRRRIDEMGLRLHPTSKLARALDQVERFRELLQRREDQRWDNDMREAYEYFGTVVGADFLSKAIHRAHEHGLALARDRFQRLCSGDPIVTKVGSSSKSRNETWETLIACLATPAARGIKFDEPDVVCTYQGKTFAIAAKAPSSKSNLFDKVMEGFDQANGKAEATLVYVNLVNVFPVLEEFQLSVSRRFIRNEPTVTIMKNSVARWCNTFPLADYARMIQQKARTPVGVAFFIPYFIYLGGSAQPFFYTHLPLTWAGSTSIDFQFAKACQDAGNSVLSFVAAPAPNVNRA